MSKKDLVLYGCFKMETKPVVGHTVNMDKFKSRYRTANNAKQGIWTAYPKIGEKMQDIARIWEHDWVYLLIDNRYLIIDGMEQRLAISYGVNTTSPTEGGFFAPSEQRGDMVFGIHAVLIARPNALCLCDSWRDSAPAKIYSNLFAIKKAAQSVLNKFDDEQYKRLVAFYGEVGEFATSARTELESFDIYCVTDQIFA